MTTVTPTIKPSPIGQPLFEFMWNFLQVTEAVIPRVYSDSLGIPTLGVGYALIIPSGNRYILRPGLVPQLESIKINLTQPDINVLNRVAQLLNDMAPYRKALAQYKPGRVGKGRRPCPR